MSTAQTLRSSLETFAATSYGPQPKDIYVAQQWEMAGAHAMLMNGLLNIYEVNNTMFQAYYPSFWLRPRNRQLFQ